MFKKKIIPFLLMGTIFCSTAMAADKLPETVTMQDGSTAVVVASDRVEKIKWEKPTVVFQQYSQLKLESIKKRLNAQSIEFPHEDGIMADFAAIEQHRVGRMNSQFGELTLVWHNTPEFDNTQMMVCKGDVCSSNIKLKALNGKEGLLVGDFKKIINKESAFLDIEDTGYLAIAKVRIKELLSSRPYLEVYNQTYNDDRVHEIKFLDIEPVINETSGLYEQNGSLDINGTTNVKLVWGKDKRNAMLGLEDGTRVYARSTDQDGVVDLFYLDFNNKKSGEKITVVDLGLVKKFW